MNRPTARRLWGIALLGSALLWTSLTPTALGANPSDVRRLVETRACPACDLRGADLRAAYLRGAELPIVNLAGANLRAINREGSGWIQPPPKGDISVPPPIDVIL